MKKDIKRKEKKRPTTPGVTQAQFEMIVQAAKKRAAEMEYLKDR